MNAPSKEISKDASPKTPVGRHWWWLSLASVILPFLSQPPFAWWPVAAVAVLPYLLAASFEQVTRKQYAVLYVAATVYWALTLQGLRYANPLIYPCWIALSAYLAIYPIAFTVVLRRGLKIGIPVAAAAPLAWVGMECVRNYMLTGISAAMLGHTLADVPSMVQIADLGGTYAVSMVIVSFNVALYSVWQWRSVKDVDQSETKAKRFPIGSCAAALVLLALTFAYGRYRLAQPTAPSSTRIALIGGNEAVEYEQDPSRELELFDAYARESIRAIQTSDDTIEAVVWPESMFTGTLPWMIGEGDAEFAQAQGLSIEEVRAMIQERRRAFQFRANSLQSMLAEKNGPDSTRPQIVGGCGVVDYGPTTKIYSGMVHVGDEGSVMGWYGKMHLVMFGEYIPLVKSLPFVRDWVPPNMGMTTGDTAQRFQIGDVTLCPNICIETAVERVTINQLRQLQSDDVGQLPDAVVTVTNDGWFDDSSVVQHHKRCAQLVAVACRRPILSAANNGPTMWVDSCGRVIKELPQGEKGSVVVTPDLDQRVSLVMWIGDWPARICAILFLVILVRRPHLRPK